MKYVLLVLVVLNLVLTTFLFVDKKESKVGFVETSKVLSELRENRGVEDSILVIKDKWSVQIDSLSKELDVLVSNPTDSLKAKEAYLKVNQLKQIANQEMQKKESELMKTLVQDINVFLADWGEENGFDMIHGTLSSGNILYGAKGLDLTQEVLKGLKKEK